MPPCSQFKELAYVWKPMFSQRQTPLYQSEDGKHFHVPKEINPETDDVLGRFIDSQYHHDVHHYLYQRLQFARFLGAADIESLRGEGDSHDWKQKVLIDDRNNWVNTAAPEATRPVRNCRQALGPMTAPQFYSELLKDRVGVTETPDAERRLIYITDLDSFCALALAATVSSRQAPLLRNFLYKHLTLRTLIGVHIPPIVWPTFCLEFHLPYYAWRRMPPIIAEQILNHRRHNGGTLPRRTEPVLQLGRGKPTEEKDGLKDYIHEAQISIMITGLDDWFWTAYCFVDLYFKDETHLESVHRLSGCSDTNTPSMDPHSGGKMSMDRPLWDPRHYFLRVLSCRMKQVRQEWTNTIHKLFEDIDPCIYSFTRCEAGDKEASDLLITQQNGFKWAIRVLREFAHLLSRTINSWETFKEGEIGYFNLPDTSSPQAAWSSLLATVDKDVTELKDLHGSLIYRTELFENMTNSIVTHAAHAETILTRLQSQFIQALTVITIFYLPPSLASAVFSMQNTVISNLSFRDWVYTLIGLFIATAVLVITVLVMNLPEMSKLGSIVRERIAHAWAVVCQGWRSVDRWKARIMLKYERQVENDIEMGGSGYIH